MSTIWVWDRQTDSPRLWATATLFASRSSVNRPYDAVDLHPTVEVNQNSLKRRNEEECGFPSITKEARLTASRAELEMYVQPTQNVWWKYRQKKVREARSPTGAQTIRITTKHAQVRA